VLEFERTWNYRGAVRDYARAFREYGVDVKALPAEEAVARLQSRPALAVAVAAALDDWVLALGRGGPGRGALLGVSRRLCPHPLRDRLRAAWDQPITPALQAELRKLAESIDAKTQSPTTLVTLAVTLHDVRLADSAIRILRDGQFIYPRDFWLNFTLGY